MYFPWCVRNPLICHQQIPSQMWQYFLPRKRYSLAFSNHWIGKLRDGHEPSQLYTAKPNLWDAIIPCSFWAHPGMSEMWLLLGTLGGLVGSPKLWFIQHVQIHSERLWSLPLQYRVWWIQDDELHGSVVSNQSTLTQDAQDNLGHLQWSK